MISEFIVVNKLKARLIPFEDDVGSSFQAAKLVQAPLSRIVKSLVFLDETREPVVLLLRGSDQADMEKVKTLLGIKQLKLANPKQVLEITGYEIGGGPPISIFGIKTICDEKVMQESSVFSGGGNSKTLLEISPGEIKEYVDDFVVAYITVN